MDKGKLVLVSAIANIFEWYDYALFTHFTLIIGEQFFPKSDPSTAQLYVFLVFATGYLMRPIGGVFFGFIGDRFGRKAALSASVICMGIPTAVIGVLPTYETIGVLASTLMVIARVLQGLSMGGTLTGSVSFIIEHTEKKHRGFIGSIPMSSICIGILLGSAMSCLIKFFLSAEQFYQWGWRLPFFLGIVIFFIGLYIRKYTEETPLFKKLRNSGQIVSSPTKHVISRYWFDMLISIFINSTGSIIFYLEAIFLTVYLKSDRAFPEDSVDSLINFCYVLMAFATLFFGWLSDKISRKKIFVINLVIIIFSIPFLLSILEEGNFAICCVAQICISILAAAYIGPEPALQSEFYPTNVRNSALSLSYNIATSLFGGMTPYVIALLTLSTNTLTASAFYIIICAVISLISLYYYVDRSSMTKFNTDNTDKMTF